ncbi:uncharacterized protein [Penaeus vannamei]|uniref:uncharacterized protein n=1 Tax=Penaeus vannamei TaxID=6689 RepID=UPI00387F5F7E
MMFSSSVQDFFTRMPSSSHTVIFLLVLSKLIAADDVLAHPTRVPGSSHLLIKSEFPYLYWRASPRPYTPSFSSVVTQGHSSYPYFYGESASEHVSDATTWQAMPIQLPDDLVGAFDERTTYSTTTQTPPYPTQISPQYGRHPGMTERPHLFHPERLYPSSYNKVNRVIKYTESFNSNHNYPSLGNTTVTQQPKFNFHDPSQDSSKLPLWHGSFMEQLKLPELPKFPNMHNLPNLAAWPLNFLRGNQRKNANRKTEPKRTTAHTNTNKTHPGLYMATAAISDQPYQKQWQNTTYQPSKLVETSKNESFQANQDDIVYEYYYDYEGQDHSHVEQSDDWYTPPIYQEYPDDVHQADNKFHSDHRYNRLANESHIENHGIGDTQYKASYYPPASSSTVSDDQYYQQRNKSYTNNEQVLQKHHYVPDHHYFTNNQGRPIGGGNNHWGDGYLSFNNHWPHTKENQSDIAPLHPKLTQESSVDNGNHRPLQRRRKPGGQQDAYFARPHRQPHLRPRPGQLKRPNYVDRVMTGDTVTSSVFVPGGMLIVALALALFYFNFVWYPTPVVTARLIQKISDSAPDNFLSDSRRKAVEKIYEVFRSLELEYTEEPEPWTDVCKSRFVCEVHRELPGLWQVTQTCAALIRSSLVKGPQENGNFTMYFEAAQKGSRGGDCVDYYKGCYMRQIPIRLSLQEALGIYLGNTTEVIYN